MFGRSTALVAGSVAVAVALSGCSLLEAGGEPEPLTGVAACALGHVWELDVADYAPKMKEEFARRGLGENVEITGTQRLDWNEKGHVLLTADMQLTLFVQVTGDFAVTVNQQYAGDVTGAAYISGDVAIPRRWDDSAMTISTQPEANGSPIEESPWQLPSLVVDDSVGLEITCDGDALTIHPRGGKVTQVWTKVGDSTI
ncbi:hypothetical protein M2152_001482 [Microbacteriaceae bacterium SG_E_30_P1]|uniref:Lipoprotein n=1 Tax=Antiquaquibacter oligotrophicus TaxID=2880260 RepID=A0ABT6KNH0_9MICO|nr:hypothetical protein [Antiquaquibacter oligotrophicus]MDH6181300.1 hypothetical protein [Antiquaquibacter oligotrophicus]UDF13007.1 hypothetical protein LH407_12705 [Antiquaquibacter oligotrophicus]